MGKHSPHQAHPPVPVARTKTARGGLTTCAGGYAHDSSDDGCYDGHSGQERGAGGAARAGDVSDALGRDEERVQQQER